MVVLAHGSNDEYYKFLREDLEKLVRSGSNWDVFAAFCPLFPVPHAQRTATFRWPQEHQTSATCTTQRTAASWAVATPVRETDTTWSP